MNNDHLKTSKFSNLSISPIEEAAIKQRADRVGKQMGEAISSVLAEVMLAVLAGKPQMTLPRPDDTLMTDKAAKTPTESGDFLTTGKSAKEPDGILATGKATKTPKEPDGLLKASEVANILRISKALAYRLMQQGEIPTIQFGRTTRVRQQDLEEFIGKHLKSGMHNISGPYQYANVPNRST